MKNILNAGKALVAGEAMITLGAILYLATLDTAPSSDPYDNLQQIGVGAQLAILLFAAVVAGVLALCLIGLAIAVDRSSRSRSTVWWSLAALGAPVVVIVLFW
ncbi:MAG: hypothetical protein ACYC7A_18465 [Thermoanaerobaculia bacterium]